MRLAIVKAAHEWIKLENHRVKYLAKIESDAAKQRDIVSQWGDALSATINEIKAKIDNNSNN